MACAVCVAVKEGVAVIAGDVLPKRGCIIVDAKADVVDAIEAEGEAVRHVARIERAGGDGGPLPGDFHLVAGGDGDGENTVARLGRAVCAE